VFTKKNKPPKHFGDVLSDDYVGKFRLRSFDQDSARCGRLHHSLELVLDTGGNVVRLAV